MYLTNKTGYEIFMLDNIYTTWLIIPLYCSKSEREHTIYQLRDEQLRIVYSMCMTMCAFEIYTDEQHGDVKLPRENFMMCKSTILCCCLKNKIEFTYYCIKHEQLHIKDCSSIIGETLPRGFLLITNTLKLCVILQIEQISMPRKKWRDLNFSQTIGNFGSFVRHNFEQKQIFKGYIYVYIMQRTNLRAYASLIEVTPEWNAASYINFEI